MFETVHTCTDWYDGPRRGIADYQGRPHLYESEWKDGDDLDATTFLLSPVDDETFALAMEDWAIWRRWETAFHQGRVTQDSHPALPEERSRHEELKCMLERKLKIDPARAFRKAAEFRARTVEGCGGRSCPSPMEVCWTDS
jgi:hypothetical protein